MDQFGMRETALSGFLLSPEYSPDKLTSQASREQVPAGHMLDGHTRLALQEPGDELRLRLLDCPWEERASSSA